MGEVIDVHARVRDVVEGRLESYSFPTTLGAGERKLVHQLAKRFGINSGSVGVEGGVRQLTISKQAVRTDSHFIEGADKERSREEVISRHMSNVLRHTAIKRGVFLDDRGYASVDDLLRLEEFQKLRVTHTEIISCTSSNNKQRFRVDERGGRWYVRANQGHTIKGIKDDLMMTTVTPALVDRMAAEQRSANGAEAELLPLVVHGTYSAAWPLIVESGGLRTMGRKHVHFAPERPDSGKVVSGMRSDCDIAVFLDLKRAVEAGVKFYISDNHVVLTPGVPGRLDNKDGLVPMEFFDRVEDVSNRHVIWRRGSGTQELAWGEHEPRLLLNAQTGKKAPTAESKGSAPPPKQSAAAAKGSAPAAIVDVEDSDEEIL